ncbi:MFS transporter [Dactylosporangium fulvum]|uniref:MFS transporter n=1 Tax=Dactylosporangium fulvum TaxID=53359 RepID=A0ABY5W881_9ACTN|nr:MFS transporter [Dactylosporangium fulvum]UWP85429.1 MFS transporter [Dactylosporangium fulvum]
MPDSGIRAVLRAPQVLLVLTASQVGRLPLASAPLALLVYARQAQSLALAGIVVAIYTAGMAVTAPLLARTVDRWRQSPVLWGSAAFSAVGFALVAYGGHRISIMLLGAAVAGLGTPPLEACLRALWPALVPSALVPVAYTLDIAVQEIIFVVGPLITLSAVALSGPAAGVLTAAALQLGGVAAFTVAPAVREWRGVPAHRHWAGPLRVRHFSIMVVGVACVGAAVGSLPVALTGYAEAAGDRSLTGWLLAAQAGGALIGGLLYTRAAPGDARRLPLLAVAFAAGYVPLVGVPGPGFMAALVAVSGLALPPLLTAVFLAADRLAPKGTAVEAFAWIMTAFTVGSALGAALTGTLAETNLRYGFLFAPAIGVVSVLSMALVSGERTRRR